MIKCLSVFVAACLLLTSLPVAAEGLGPRRDKVAVASGTALPADDKDDSGDKAEAPGFVTMWSGHSPVLAGGLSLILPGAGQLYNEQYLVGSLWMAGEIALYLGAFGYAGAFDPSEKFHLSWRWQSVLLFAFAGGFHLFSIFDAVTEASRLQDNANKYSFMITPDDDGVTVGYGFNW